MLADEFPGLGIHAFDVALKFTSLDTPLPAPADFDRGQFPVADKGIRLGRRDIQGLGDVCEGQEAHTSLSAEPHVSRQASPSAVDNHFALLAQCLILTSLEERTCHGAHQCAHVGARALA